MKSNEFDLQATNMIGGHLLDNPEVTSPYTLGSLGSTNEKLKEKDLIENIRKSIDIGGGGFNNLD